MTEEFDFDYRGCNFACKVEKTDHGLYQAHVLFRHGLTGMQQTALPIDGDPYASAPEARRHAAQQAMRWVHDRTGDGQGQF
jgi:hypothetical protein